MASIIKVDTIQTAAGGTPTAADLGLNVTGSVLQTVETQSHDVSEITSSSTSYTASGIQVRITPSSANNKILVHFSSTMVDANADSGGNWIAGKMYVDGSVWTNAGQYQMGYQDFKARYSGWSWEGIWNPTNTDEILFEPYFRSGNGNTVKLAHNDSSYILRVMEIAG